MLGKSSKAKCLSKQPEFSRVDKSRPFFLRGLTLLVFLLTGAALFYINTHVQVVGIGYEINQALTKKQNLIEENKKLSLEIARLRSPDRIETEAREKLKLTVPNPHQWVPLAQLPASLHVVATAAEVPSPSPSPQPTGNPKETKAKPAPAKEKITSARAPEKKILVARIIGGESSTEAHKTSPVKQVAKNIAQPKENVPAVMLDSMP
jgi:cell division protein FtsL